MSWKGRGNGRSISKVLFQHFTGETEENKEKTCQYIRYLGQESNTIAMKHEKGRPVTGQISVFA
jgi:hypothetical protein